MEISNRVSRQKSELYFLSVFLLGIFVLTFFIFKPFLYALILAVVFATVFTPLHKKALTITRGRRSLAALLATISVLIVVIVPLAFLGIQIFQEATQLYSSFVNNDSEISLSRDASDIIQNLKKFLPVPIEFSVDVDQYSKQGLGWLLQHIGSLFSNIAKALVGVFIFLVALYYLFKDGHKLKVAVVALSPLQDIHDETIFNKLGDKFGCQGKPCSGTYSRHINHSRICYLRSSQCDIVG